MPIDMKRIEQLHQAAGQGKLRVVQRLLADGVPINARQKDGTTALIAAAAKGQSAMVRLLLSKGADANAKHRSDGTALIHVLVRNALGSEGDSVGTVRALIEAGANVNLADRDGCTPLMHCFSLYTRDAVLVDMLLAAGADVHRRAKDTTDALYWAVVYHHDAAVKRLLKAGAEVDRIYEEGRTLLDRLDKDGDGKVHRSVATMYKLIRKAGGRYAREFQAGRAARQQQVEVEKKEAAKEERSRRADLRVIPDFSQAANTASFRSAVEELERICGASVLDAQMVPGMACCQVAPEKGKELLEKHRAWFRARGCYLFRRELRWFGPGGTQLLAVLPATDQLQVVVAAAAGCGDNHGIGIAKVIRGLKKIHSLTPFIVDRVDHDTVEGRFLRKHKKPDEIARVMYRICPDIVSQGTETVEALAALLKKSDRLFLWWD